MAKLVLLAALFCKLTTALPADRTPTELVAPVVRALKTPSWVDADDAVVARRTEGKFASCTEVKAAGLCGHAMAKQSCVASCTAEAAVDEVQASYFTPQGGKDAPSSGATDPPSGASY